MIQEKRAAATREHLLDAAFTLLVDHPEQPFSHEAVAKAAGVGARTVYRYFPAQADLLEGCWLKLRERSRTVFPVEEDEIVDKLGEMYRAFDDNERLVRAVIASEAGARVRARGAEESRASFDRSLRDATAHLDERERRQVRAVFQGLHSALFWSMLHDRGGLSKDEAIDAAIWAARALLKALRKESKKEREGKHK
jgi:AcrR family transcriptional regulator